jgi:vacuolar-type H+-ATPase catalytic subunit A/Vma1
VARLTFGAMAAFWQVDAWLARLRRFWSAHIDALERYLNRMDDRRNRSTRSNGKAEGNK